MCITMKVLQVKDLIFSIANQRYDCKCGKKLGFGMLQQYAILCDPLIFV